MTPPDQPNSNSPVDELSDRFWEGILELNPTTATVYGDERYDDRLEDPSPAGRARARALMEQTKAEAEAISPDGLSIEDRITRDMLIVIGELGIEEDEQGTHRLRVVDQIGGPQTLLPQLCQFQRADTPERLEKFIARLRAYPAYMAANIDILREGLETGLTAPRIVAERTLQQLERLLAIPIEEAIVPSMAQVASEADRERVREVVRDEVYPADAAFLEALRGDYLAATRVEPGLWSAPSGDALYKTQIRAWTTLDLDPRDVHQIGMEELEATEVGRREIANAAGFGDDTKAYRASLAADPDNTPTVEGRADRPGPRGHRPGDGDRTALLRDAAAGRPRSQGGRGVQGEGRTVRLLLPAVDRRLAIRASTTPTATTCRAASTPSWPRRRITRRSRATTSRSRSRWRTRTSTPSAASARGWSAAPTSRAGACTARSSPTRWASIRNDAERFGMFDAVAWRAARLVVDTGLHALRWTRQQSIDFLLEAGLSETDAVIETDRYIAWPGQALTYMIGCREIVRLRAEIAARDGSAFDLKAFHDAILGHGSLPLATLSRELPNWVATPA